MKAKPGHLTWVSAILLAGLTVSTPGDAAGPGRVVFTGADIHDGRGHVWPGGQLAVEGDRIMAVGEGVRPARGDDIVSMRGRVLIPGLIDANSSLLAGQSFMYDRNAPSAPNLRVADALRPLSGIHGGPAALMTGLTIAYLSPGSWRPIGGQGVVVQLHGESRLDMELKGTSFVHMAINSGPLFEYGRGPGMPQTTMGIVSVIRSRLQAARAYATARGASGSQPREFDPDLDALAQVLSGERTARIDVDTARDIQLAISLADEFGFRPVLDHCVEAYRVKALLAERKFPLVLLPFTPGDVSDLDREREMLAAPGWLAQQGVPVAFQTSGHGMPPYGSLHPYSEPRSVFLDAILQVRMGMDREEVLRALTSTPAAILGIDDRVGSLEAGKLANFVVLSGPPFEYTTRILEVWMLGQKVFDLETQRVFVH